MDTRGYSTGEDTIIAIRHVKDQIHKIGDATKMIISRDLIDLCKNAQVSVAHDAKRKEEELLETKRKQQDRERDEKQRNRSVQLAELDNKITFLKKDTCGRKGYG